MVNSSDNILQTKIPKLLDNWIVRDKLIKKMHDQDSKIIFLNAHAGFGKTILMTQYAHNFLGLATWYTLKKEDNSIKTFYKDFVESLNTDIHNIQIFRDYDIEEDIEVVHDAAIYVSRMITDYLSYKTEIELNIFLDEFQIITNANVLLFVHIIIMNIPDNVKIFIATTDMVSGFFKHYEEENLSSIIGAKDLTFKEDEIVEIADKLEKPRSIVRAANVLFECTDGWPIGVIYALMQMKDIGAGRKVSEFDNCVYENMLNIYIHNMVFKELSQEIKKFMLKTSILDYINAEHCNHLLGINNSEIFIHKILLKNLFLMEVEGLEGTYRYYRNFKRFLNSKIPKTEYELLLGLKSAPIEKLKENVNDTMHNNNKKLYVTCFGEFSVYLGKNKKELDWRTKKAKELFAYLIHIRGKYIDRSSLIEHIFPDESTENGVKLLHNTIYSIRKKLGIYGFHDIIEYKSKKYRINMESIYSDLEELLMITHAVHKSDIHTLCKCSKFLLNYKGEYMKNMDVLWISETREYFEKIYIKSYTYIGEKMMIEKKYEEAIQYLKIALEIDPFGEKLAAMLIRCYKKIGDLKSLNSFYSKFIYMLQKELNIKSSKIVKQAYEESIFGIKD